jgi:hypothetical protein
MSMIAKTSAATASPATVHRAPRATRSAPADSGDQSAISDTSSKAARTIAPTPRSTSAGWQAGAEVQEKCRYTRSCNHDGEERDPTLSVTRPRRLGGRLVRVAVARWAERMYAWRSPSTEPAGSVLGLGVWLAWLVALGVSAGQGHGGLAVMSAAVAVYLAPDAWLNWRRLRSARPD